MKKIIAYWKCEDRYEVYSSLTGFVERNDRYNRETITYYITRKGIPYQTNELMLVRANYLNRKNK